MPNGRRWDDGLVGIARDIASINHSPIRVLAGPVNGKTFPLIRRAARFLQEVSYRQAAEEKEKKEKRSVDRKIELTPHGTVSPCKLRKISIIVASD